MPVLAVTATLAAASMAAVPPLFGFISKEAAYEAFLHGGPGGLLTLTGLFLGSVLTGAYSARFVWGAFATKPACALTPVHAASPLFLAPVVLLGALSLLLGLVPFVADPLVQAYAAQYAEEPEPYHLALWHGPSAALLLSAMTLGGAAFLFVGRDRFRAVQRRTHRVLGLVDADRSYDATVRGVDGVALRSTALVQTGSLPVYLGMVLLTLVALPGVALLADTRVTSQLRAWDTPMQLVVGIVIAAAAVATARAHRRFTAVLFLGAVGYGIAVLFVLQGGPDLALTQFLVETLTLVIFVFVLRRLPSHFSHSRLRLSQAVRLGVALAVGAFVTTAVLVATQSRTAPAASQAYLDQAYEEGGGSNVVNVILVDFRGLDTLGEITVLAVAAMGIASLVLAARRAGTPSPPVAGALAADDVSTDPDPAPEPEGPGEPSPAGAAR
jgi:multicomponent Na+:H+ antiporter subunit A